MKPLTEAQAYFLDILEDTADVRLAAEKAGISIGHAYNLASAIKEHIQERTRDRLTMASLRASKVLTDGLEADEHTVKGELRLKSAESILDRSGITKHTHVEVGIGDSNGLFIIPAKAPVPPENTED